MGSLHQVVVVVIRDAGVWVVFTKCHQVVVVVIRDGHINGS